MPKPIATLELLGSSPAGDSFPVYVSVFEPVLEEKTCFACEVDIRPLQTKPLKIYGEGSLQALSLAMSHAVQTLATFVEHGGGKLMYEDGESFEPKTYGFKLLGEQ